MRSRTKCTHAHTTTIHLSLIDRKTNWICVTKFSAIVWWPALNYVYSRENSRVLAITHTHTQCAMCISRNSPFSISHSLRVCVCVSHNTSTTCFSHISIEHKSISEYNGAHDHRFRFQHFFTISLVLSPFVLFSFFFWILVNNIATNV